jgi:AcrR family transcriptional regulator
VTGTADAPRRRGRRPGQSTTREEVLTAARAAFAEQGYEAATIREIARRAAVDPSLVVQYFASKERLFAAAMDLPFDPAAAVSAIVDGPPSAAGTRMVTTFLRLWDHPETGPRMLALLRSAATHPAAADRLRDLIDGQLLGPVAERLAAPQARLRAHLIGSQLVGLGFARYILRLEPLASASLEEICQLVAPAVQHYFRSAE